MRSRSRRAGGSQRVNVIEYLALARAFQQLFEASVEVPKVSIVIPAYNSGPLLRDTLAGIRSQTRQDF